MFTLGIAASSLIKLEIIFEATGNATYVPEEQGDYVTTPQERFVADTTYINLTPRYLDSAPFQLNGRSTNFVYYRDEAGGILKHFLVLADEEGGDISGGGYQGVPTNSGWKSVTVTNNTTGVTVTHLRSAATFAGTAVVMQSGVGHSAGAWSWDTTTDTLPFTDNTDSITVVIGK